MGSEELNSLSSIMKSMKPQRGGISESSTTSDNTTDFIEIVKKYDIVYNTHHPDYKNVEVKLKIWFKIAEEIGLSVDASKRKWKNLRDSYTKYLRSFRVGTKTSKKYQFWAHAEHMEFLKPYQGPGRSSTNALLPKDDDDNECDLGYQVLAKATANTGEEDIKTSTLTNNPPTLNIPITSSIASMISNYANAGGGITTSGMGLTMSTGGAGSGLNSTAGTMILPVPSLPTVQLPPSLTAKPIIGSLTSSSGSMTLPTASSSSSYSTSSSLASLTSSSMPSQVFALPQLSAKGPITMPSSNTASSVGCLIIEPQLFASADTFKKEFNSSSSSSTSGTQITSSNLQIYPNISAQMTPSSQAVANRLNPPLITKIRRVQPSPQSSAINLSFSTTPSSSSASSLLSAYNANGYTTTSSSFMPTIGGPFGGGSTTITATTTNGLSAGPPPIKKPKNADSEISAILQANRDLDANTLFFLSLARSVKTMPTKFQSLAKMRCMRIVSDIELELDNINNDPSDTSLNSTKYCTNNTDSPPPAVGSGAGGVGGACGPTNSANQGNESQSEHFVYVMSPSRLESMIDLSSDEENPQNNGN